MSLGSFWVSPLEQGDDPWWFSHTQGCKVSVPCLAIHPQELLDTRAALSGQKLFLSLGLALQRHPKRSIYNQQQGFHWAFPEPQWEGFGMHKPQTCGWGVAAVLNLLDLLDLGWLGQFQPL